MYDTLLTQVNKDETIAILGHELGHWKFGHVTKNMIVASVQVLVQFFLFGKVMNSVPLYTSFGFDATTSYSVIIGLIVFSQILSPVNYILGLVLTHVSRVFEFQADAFAVSLGYSKQLQSGLVKIHTENLGNMNPDPWYSAYHFSHPPLVERIRGLKAAEQSMKLKKQR
eukprot:GILK01000555.1.p1 GENE.GILK01000555.1~~GILK01000555.1.p1  ORF type:complete len:169 (-),score=28.05 GILK01000555.1:160-666(-)